MSANSTLSEQLFENRSKFLVIRVALHVRAAGLDMPHDTFFIENKRNARPTGIYRLPLCIAHPAMKISPLGIKCDGELEAILRRRRLVNLWIKRAFVLVMVHADHNQSLVSIAFIETAQTLKAR